MNKSGLKIHSSEIVKRLAAEYPDVKCHLDFNSPFELLISTVLAAQCTDIRVNMVMTPLYKTKYKSPSDIINDGINNYRENIKSINFFNNKAKSVLSICDALVNKFGGKVPDNMDDLTSLSGVGRKSASVILGNCFGKNDVIIVDTHLKRVSARLGLIENEDPEKIEDELKKLIPADAQFYFSMRIGEHGRQVCKAKKPDCEKCFLNDICPSAFKI
ncbi:MAG: endonuclease III [Ignavibacteria bacterium]|nr:endonuclease III [Ignavibacteria bacterium]